MIRAFGPGRVNLIGEHTDYNGGLALPFAIDLGVTVEAEPLGGGEVRAEARDLGEHDAFPAADPQPAEGWRAFVRGTGRELRAIGVPVAGARLAFSGDVPAGSGLSSSAALEAGAEPRAARPWRAPTEPDRTELAKLCSRVENDWVGAETGLLDHLASLRSRAGEAIRIDFATLAIEPVPLRLGDWRLVDARVGGRARPRRRRLQRAPRRVPRRLRGARASSSSARRTRRPPPRSRRRWTGARATC